jgi:hypothetical protein
LPSGILDCISRSLPWGSARVFIHFHTKVCNIPTRSPCLRVCCISGARRPTPWSGRCARHWMRAYAEVLPWPVSAVLEDMFTIEPPEAFREGKAWWARR